MILHFDTPHFGFEGEPVDTVKLRESYGGKGANLWIMTNQMGLPVPHGFSLSTAECRAYMAYGEYSDAVDAQATFMESVSHEVAKATKLLESKMGRKLGAKKNPLLVSVRSGARVSMPGMMDTILNLGLNDETVAGLAKQTSEDFAFDSYRRFLQMYGTTVVGVDKAHFEQIVNAAKRFSAGKLDADLNAILIRKFKETLGDNFPQDVTVQLKNSIEAVFKSWNCERAIAYREAENIPHDWGTAVNVQSMVFGNMNEQSGTGVVFTRNPSTGENAPYGDFLVNAQGEDVVDGSHVTTPIAQMAEVFPAQYRELTRYMNNLEDHFKDMCDIEFTIEDGKLWILQTRSGKRSATAAVRIALDMVKSDLIDSAVGTERIMAATAGLTASTGDDDNFTVEIGFGEGACDGIAIGKVVFDAETAVKWAEDGEAVILVREQTEPADVKGIAKSVGILTMVGGLVSHAAVVARGWNKVCIVSASTGGLSLNSSRTKLKADGHVIVQGDLIKLDGTTGKVYVTGR